MKPITYADTFLSNLRRVDDVMCKAGHPAIHARWWQTLERFAYSGRRQLTVRKGRRTGASSIIGPRVAVAVLLTLGSTLKLPPGEIAELAFVSVKRGEASQRLGNIEAVLRALGILFVRRGDSIVLQGLPFVFQVRTASAHTEVGGTIAFLWCDELSRWKDDATGTNPASEVLSSLKPSLATIRNAYIFLISSPLSTTDFHAKEFDRGEQDGDQIVDHFPTWEATDLLTKEDTRQLEKDPRIWGREYGDQTQASVGAAFVDGIAHVVPVGTTQRPYVAGTEYAVAIDAGGASRTGKSQTVVTVAHAEWRQLEEGGAVLRTLVIDCVKMLKPSFLRPVKFKDIVNLATDVCRSYHVTSATSDIHLFAALQPELSQNGIVLVQAPMDLVAQAARSTTLVSMVSSSSIDLLDLPDLRKQMSECVLRERGQHFIITKPDRSGARDDIVDTILLLVEKQAKLKVAGNAGIRRSPARLSFIDGRLNVSRPARYYRLGANGSGIPVDTPRDAVEYKQHQLERWRKDITTPGDLREFGSDEALAAAKEAALHAEAATEYGDLADSEIEFPQSPEEQMLGIRLGRIGPNRSVQ